MRPTRLSFPPADADVIGFADWLCGLFRNRSAALATIVRLSDEYRAWRAAVEYCQHCRRRD